MSKILNHGCMLSALPDKNRNIETRLTIHLFAATWIVQQQMSCQMNILKKKQQKKTTTKTCSCLHVLFVYQSIVHELSTKYGHFQNSFWFGETRSFIGYHSFTETSSNCRLTSPKSIHLKLSLNSCFYWRKCWWSRSLQSIRRLGPESDKFNGVSYTFRLHQTCKSQF